MTTPTTLPKDFNVVPSYIPTVEYSELFDLCLKAVKRFVKGSNDKRLLRYFGSHYTLDDLAMEAVEKIVKANPQYLTRSYVNMASKCACIDRLQQPKLPWQDVPAFILGDEGDPESREEALPGNSFDYTADTLKDLLEVLDAVDIDTLEGLQTDKMYTALANERGISTRTFERRVKTLREKAYATLMDS